MHETIRITKLVICPIAADRESRTVDDSLFDDDDTSGRATVYIRQNIRGETFKATIKMQFMGRHLW